MALTGRIIASIYRKGVNDLNTGGMGRMHNLPSALCKVRDLDPTLTANGVVMNAVITLLPTGLRNVNEDYYTPSTAAQIITNGS